MALNVEGVVGGRMEGQESLGLNYPVRLGLGVSAHTK
jgi:hypothetical protein